jgi:4'-phosphopantetheinyl transferase
MLFSRDEIHVWSVSVSRAARRLPLIISALSHEECDRHAKFVREEDATLFAVGRALLRFVLGSYVGVSPRSLSLREGPFGKPVLARSHRAPFRFNLTHSGDIAMCAITVEREVGIDVEAIRPVYDLEALVRSAFSDSEQRAIFSIRESERLNAFFATWCRKEAVIKALGRGLSFPLDAFDVEVAPAAPPVLLASRDPLLNISRWTMSDLPQVQGYASALAVEGAVGSVVIFREWSTVALADVG